MRTIITAGLLFLAAGTVTPQPGGADLRAKLQSRVNQYSVTANGLADALIKTSKQFGVPIGIEWMRDKDTARTFNATWRDETVLQVFQSIIGSYSRYKLGVDGGLVHVFREDLPNDRHNFLNLRIPGFFRVQNEPAGLANVELRKIIQDIVSDRAVTAGAGEAGSYTSGNVPEKPLTIDLSGENVRQALNRLASLSEHNVWVVTFSNTDELTPTGFRKTETLWHPAPFPVRSQPMWDFLAWGEYLPGVGRP